MKNPLIFIFFLIFSNPALAETSINFSPERDGSAALAVGVYDDLTLGPDAAALDAETGGAISKIVANSSKFRGLPGQALHAVAPAGFAADWLIIFGMGNAAGTPKAGFQDMGGGAVSKAINAGASSLEIRLGAMTLTPSEVAQIAFGAKLSAYRFEKYLSGDSEKRSPLVAVTLESAHADLAQTFYERELEPVAKAVYFARDMISEPALAIYPESFVERAREAAMGLNVQFFVLDSADMAALGMGALLGVGRGSIHPPRLLVVSYQGAGPDEAPVAFVGKGITFDSGGISLKKNDGMWKMKYDLSGAAASIGAVLALAGREARVNAVGIAALAENMPSGSAQLPGDIVTTMSGKTIEIISTDAEGRLVLSDAVWYAQETFRPRILVDLATLTGTVVRALGDEYAGLFANNDDLAAQLIGAGEASGEEIWRLPLHPSYAEDIKSDIADIKNSGIEEAGAGIGAQVIATFIQDGIVWAHLDIAGTAWQLKGLPTVPAGGAGFGVRLLDDLVRRHYEGAGGE